MYLKKGAAFVLAALLALSLCACGGDVEGGAAAKSSTLSTFTPDQVCDLFRQRMLEENEYDYFDLLGLSFGDLTEEKPGLHQMPMTLTKTKTARAGALTLRTGDSGGVVEAELSGAVDYVVLVRELFYSLDLPAEFAEYINDSWAADLGESQDWERDGLHVRYESNADGSEHSLSVYRI